MNSGLDLLALAIAVFRIMLMRLLNEVELTAGNIRLTSRLHFLVKHGEQILLQCCKHIEPSTVKMLFET